MMRMREDRKAEVQKQIASPEETRNQQEMRLGYCLYAAQNFLSLPICFGLIS